MTIKIKYAPSDKVWAMIDNKACERAIKQVRTSSLLSPGTPLTVITYALWGLHTEDTRNYKESELYPTKKALLKSL